MANINELQLAFSKTAQGAIDTPSTDLIRMSTISDSLGNDEPVVEDDADEIGKGHEFAEQSFLTHWKTDKKIECYLSSELLSVAAAFGLGNGSAGTYTPINPATNANENELPWMTVLEGIRKGGATEVLNRAMIGMVVDKFGIRLVKGPGRANAKLTIDLIGTGQVDSASTLVMPASRTAAHLLNASSLTCTINGTNYVSAKTFESFEFDWDNSTRDGNFPGSGFRTLGDATSGQIQGRMEFGKRSLKSSFSARYKNGSTELTALTAQTAGTAVIGLSGAVGHDATITMHQVTFKTSKIDNTDGIVTVKVEMSAQYEATDGLVTMVVNNALGTVGRS